MSFIIKPTKIFLQQIDNLSKEAKRLLRKKILLLKNNPYRNKRIKGYRLHLFRIRLSDRKAELRVIYLIDSNEIKIICILNRKNNYKDLIEYLKTN